MSWGTSGRRSSVPGRDTTTTIVIVRGDVEVASWPLGADMRPDLRMVDELARLQLAAGRHGWSIRLRGACDALRELLDFAGLGEVLETASGLVVEVGREPEGSEEVRIEEGVERRDPLA